MTNSLIQYFIWAAPGIVAIILADSISTVFFVGASPVVVVYILFEVVLRVPVYALTIGWAALASRSFVFFVGLAATIGLSILYFFEWRNYAKAPDLEILVLFSSAYFLVTSALWAYWYGWVLKRIKFH